MSRKIFPLAFLFCLSLFCLPSIAQPVAPPFIANLKKWERLEGTIEETRRGVTARAHLSWQAPDQLRVDTEENPFSKVRAQVVVATGDETRIVDPAIKRVQRLPYNIAKQPWRGWSLSFGGPANFLLFGAGAETVGKFYSTQIAPTSWTLNVLPEVDSYLINDYAKFGGSGDRIFYAPFKRRIFDRPSQIVIESKDIATWSRKETRDESTLTTAISLAVGLPLTAEVTDAQNRTIASFKYSLKPRAEAFATETFSFDAAPGAIVEDSIGKSIGEYSGADANTKFNLGTAYWKLAEEWPAAIAAWQESARLAPNATAPHFAIYDVAASTRDWAQANVALGKVAAILGEEHPEVLWRRAAISLALRDWKAAQGFLERAVTAQPQNLQAKLSLADVLRSQGNYERSRDLLFDILKSENAQNLAAQSPTLAEAAEMLGASSWNRADEILTKLPQDTVSQKLARAHILALQSKSFDAPETGNAAILTSLATLYERLGQDDKAVAAWKQVTESTPAPDDKNARLHLIALHARRGEVVPSLTQYRELLQSAVGLQSRRALQETLIAAWRKAFRQHQLKQALEQRALSTNATEDDARLWLTYQDAFGTQEEIAAAIQNGLSRFARSAWWRSRQSEFIFAQLSQATDLAVRDRLQRDAIEYAEQAISLDPNQPYYAVQRAVILTRRATPLTAVLEAGRYDPYKKVAHEALDETLKKWPSDADVQIAVASQRLALEDVLQPHDATIALLQNALRGSAGSAVAPDRHFVAFSTRQILSSALRDDKKYNEATEQYRIMFRASRTFEEQLGVALNYVRLLMRQKDDVGVATALLYFSHEGWNFDDSHQLLQPLINVVTSRSEFWPQVQASLRANPDPHARYLAAMIAMNSWRRNRQVAAMDNAPLSAEREFIAAEKALAEALKALEPLVVGPDKVLAARAAGMLSEAALNRTDAAGAEQWLARASQIEAREINLRTAYARALAAQNKLPQALAARDEMLRVFPHNFSTLGRAAKLSDRINGNNDGENTATLAQHAANLGQVSPEVSASDFQVAALLSARSALYANKSALAALLYNGLANEQWDDTGRAVALIDWEEALRDMERGEQADTIAARLAGLGLTPQQMAIAERSWENFNSSLN